MTECVFEYDLENEKVDKNIVGRYSVIYRKTDVGIVVEIGDGYRHEIWLEAEHWNRILKIIKNDELDNAGINAIVRGLMRPGLYEDYANNLIKAIKKGEIKEAL